MEVDGYSIAIMVGFLVLVFSLGLWWARTRRVACAFDEHAQANAKKLARAVHILECGADGGHDWHEFRLMMNHWLNVGDFMRVCGCGAKERLRSCNWTPEIKEAYKLLTGELSARKAPVERKPKSRATK